MDKQQTPSWLDTHRPKPTLNDQIFGSSELAERERIEREHLDAAIALLDALIESPNTSDALAAVLGETWWLAQVAAARADLRNTSDRDVQLHHARLAAQAAVEDLPAALEVQLAALEQEVAARISLALDQLELAPRVTAADFDGRPYPLTVERARDAQFAAQVARVL